VLSQEEILSMINLPSQKKKLLEKF